VFVVEVRWNPRSCFADDFEKSDQGEAQRSVFIIVRAAPSGDEGFRLAGSVKHVL
jgi:hypothetical protein